MADRRDGFVTRRPARSGGFTIGVQRDHVTGVVRLGGRGDHAGVSGAVLIHPRADRHHDDHGSGHGLGLGFGHRRGIHSVYSRPYPYVATYPYRYPYRSDDLFAYPYRPYGWSIYPWQADLDYYDHGSLSDYYHGYSAVHSFARRYPIYGPSYVSVYQAAPVIYRYHDVYTYYDSGAPDAPSGSTGYARGSVAATSDDAGVDGTYYADPPYDDAGVDEPFDVSSFDPPDGIGPTLDFGRDVAPLSSGSSAMGDGLVAFRSGDYEAARSAFVRTILADERDGYAKFLYGLASFALGDYAVTAISWRRAALTSELFLERPPDVRYLYDDPHAFDAQLDRLSRVAREHQDNRDVRFTLAYLLYATGEPATAGALFAGLASSDPADRLADRLASACVEVAGAFGSPPETAERR